jgi:Uma2 family endonuclease
MAVARALPDLTRTEDFLAWVWEQDYKYEMIEGRLVMMAGGSRDHSRIAVNATIAIGTRLAGQPCLPFNSDFLVETGSKNRYYPDVTVACGETRDFTDKPVLIVEVLSPSTMREDLGPKRRNYMRVPSLRYLLYLWQDEVKARLYLPSEGPDVAPRDFDRLDAVVDLPALGLSLPLRELYRDVALTSA